MYIKLNSDEIADPRIILNKLKKSKKIKRVSICGKNVFQMINLIKEFENENINFEMLIQEKAYIFGEEKEMIMIIDNEIKLDKYLKLKKIKKEIFIKYINKKEIDFLCFEGINIFIEKNGKYLNYINGKEIDDFLKNRDEIEKKTFFERKKIKKMELYLKEKGIKYNKTEREILIETDGFQKCFLVNFFNLKNCLEFFSMKDEELYRMAENKIRKIKKHKNVICEKDSLEKIKDKLKIHVLACEEEKNIIDLSFKYKENKIKKIRVSEEKYLAEQYYIKFIKKS